MKKKYLLLGFIFSLLTLFQFTQAQETTNPYSADFEADYNYNISKPYNPECWITFSMNEQTANGAANGTRYIGQNGNQTEVQTNTCYFNFKAGDTISFYYRIRNDVASGIAISQLKPLVGLYAYGAKGDIPTDVSWIDTLKATTSMTWFKKHITINQSGLFRVVIYADVQLITTGSNTH